MLEGFGHPNALVSFRQFACAFWPHTPSFMSIGLRGTLRCFATATMAAYAIGIRRFEFKLEKGDIKELKVRDWQPRSMLITKATEVPRPAFPAIDVQRSGTRREELLLEEPTLKMVWTMRRMLSAVGTNEGIELLLNRLAKTETNAAFLASLQKSAEASA